MKLKFLILASLMAWFGRDGLRAQAPDCTLPINVPTGTTVPFNMGPFDNRTAGCTTWQITYNSTVYSALSILVQTAPNASGVPGSWSTFTAASGSNPNTATTQAITTFGGPTSYFPWLRVQLTSATGAGTLSGRLYGWRNPPSATAVISGTPNVNLLQVASTNTVTGGVAGLLGVGGAAADGAAVSGSPVRVGGKDGSGNTQDLITDTTGRPVVVGAGTAGAGTGGLLTIQGDAAGTAVPISGTVTITPSGTQQVQDVGNGTVVTGQQTVTASAVALATNTARNICVKALDGNSSAAVYIGPTGITTSTGMELKAGQAWCGPVTNTNLIFVRAAAAVGDGVSWIATN